MKQFLSDLFQGAKTFLVGMKVTSLYLKDTTLGETLRRPGNDDLRPTTEEYDGTVEKALEVGVSDRFRGHLHCDTERCTVCRACEKACPIDCFWIEGEKNVNPRQRPSRFDIDILKCMYCGLCVDVCPTGCLTMTKEWWGAQQAGTPDSHGARQNFHGLVREFGVGYFTPEEKREVERARAVKAEEKKRKAAADAARKKQEALKKKEEQQRKQEEEKKKEEEEKVPVLG